MKMGNSLKAQAWQNLMTAGINAALEQGVFTLEPGPVDKKMYRFSLGDLPVVAQAHDASFDEVGLAVMVRPTELTLKSAGSSFLIKLHVP
jgi:hypothetical protein